MSLGEELGGDIMYMMHVFFVSMFSEEDEEEGMDIAGVNLKVKGGGKRRLKLVHFLL